MENNLKVFTNEQFGKVRVVEIDGEGWLVGKDVAEVLGYKNLSDALSKHIDEEDKLQIAKHDLQECEDIGTKGAIVINESGLYSLVLRSKLPQAKQFKRWVTSEVLPSIRKHGAYMTEDVLEQAIGNPDFMIGLLQTIKEERLEKERLQAKLNEAKPMIDFAEIVANTSDIIDMNEMAKLCNKEGLTINGKTIGRNKLFAYLRDKKILMDNNLPYQKYIDQKWFTVVETTKKTAYGDKTFRLTVVTGRGQIKIVEMIRSEQNDIN